MNSTMKRKRYWFALKLHNPRKYAAKIKAYKQSPEYKHWLALYMSTPEYKAKQKAYIQSWRERNRAKLNADQRRRYAERKVAKGTKP